MEVYSSFSENCQTCFFLPAGRRVCVIVRIANTLQNILYDANVFIFSKTEESCLYREFLTKWDKSWVTKPKIKKSVEKIEIRSRGKESVTKVLCPKSMTYRDVYSYTYGDLMSVVEDIVLKTPGTMKKSKGRKFRCFIMSVLRKR